MQARLELTRFPSILVAIVFALAAALVLGGAVGYVLKPASSTSGGVIVVPYSQVGAGDHCVFVDKQKEC